MPVNNPAKLTVQSLTGTVGTIAATVQTWLRANLAGADELYGVEYVRNGQNPDRITAYILFEDQ